MDGRKVSVSRYFRHASTRKYEHTTFICKINGCGLELASRHRQNHMAAMHPAVYRKLKENGK